MFQNYRPEILSFFAGFIVMLFEILGSRMVGPYIGTSLFVWTSLIAIILGALSLGYYQGGKLADKNPSFEVISLLFIFSALGFFLLFVGKDIVLSIVSFYISDVKISSIVSAICLFSVISFCLGMISPIAIKIKMTSLASGGEVLGKIGSIGTLGSIVGTLAAGFFLIPWFGVNSLLLGLGILCTLLSYFSEQKKYILFQTVLILILISGMYVQGESTSELAQKGVRVFDTSYSHISVSDSIEESSLKSVRELRIDNVTHAGMYKNSDDLLYEYTQYYHLFSSLLPDAQNIVMFGGAAYSFPKDFLKKYPDRSLEVVEIDPRITEIAKKYFKLTDSPTLHISHQDARVFLNTTKNKYDAILGDAFGSFYSVPYQLTTLETVEKKYDILSENGIVILNIIGAMKGEKSSFIQAEYKTYKQIFPEVFLIPVETTDPYEIQNIMLIAAKNKEYLRFTGLIPLHQQWLKKMTYLDINADTKVLTDDYAPVDYYVSKLLD